MRTKLNALIIFSLSCVVCRADVFLKSEEESLDQYIDAYLGCRDVPGIGIAVVRGQKTFAKGYGFANKEKNIHADNSTIFCLGSVTKSMTAMLVARLISKKEYKLDWNSKIKDILGPDYKFHDDCITDHLTLIDILSHRTGLRSVDLMLQSGVPKSVTREHIMKNLHYIPSLQEFRDSFFYNNIVYVLAAHVAEKVTEKSWEQLMREEFFDPLEMMSTVLLDTEYTQELATPYITGLDGTLNVSAEELYSLHPFGPSGSVCSSSNDMTKWLKLITSTGKDQNGAELIERRVFQDQFKPRSILSAFMATAYSLQPNFPVTYDTYAYGLGWFVSFYRGHKIVQHSGSLYGYSCKIAYIPDIESAFVFYNNGPGEAKFSECVDPVFYFLLDLTLGYQPWLNETTVCTFPQPWKGSRGKRNAKVNIKDSSNDWKNQTGLYSHPLYGNLTIYSVNGTLHARYGLILKATLMQSRSSFSVELEPPLRDVYHMPIIMEFFNQADDNKYKDVNITTFYESFSFSRLGSGSSAAELRFRVVVIIFALCFIQQ